MIIYQDTIGSSTRSPGSLLGSIGLPSPLSASLIDLYGRDISLTPPQEWAVTNGLLVVRTDMIVCAPTNSGKTLIAILKVFHEAICHGRRSVLVVPLKALAEEKAQEFNAIAEGIARYGGPRVKVTVTTGDYQMTDEFLGSPPPVDGQVVICTPERLEVMLRNPDNHPWAREVGVYVIDEFHLLGEGKRGATVESLVTRIFSLSGTATVIALSATIGNLPDLEMWFTANNRLIRSFSDNYRYPRLHRMVVVPENRDEWAIQYAQGVAADPDRGLLVFVYTRNDAEKLATVLGGESKGVAAFHAGLPKDQRARIIQDIRDRKVRIVATTTSLKMGVNFPVTDVLIRDTLWQGSRRLPLTDILQMAGRAGRADIDGRAVLLCNSNETAEFYRSGLENGKIEGIRPQLIREQEHFWKDKNKEKNTVDMDPVAGMVLTEIIVRGTTRPIEVEEYLSRTYTASIRSIPSKAVGDAFDLLETGKLIHHSEGSEDSFVPTRLGRTVSFCGISPESGAMLAGFLRALIKLSEKEREVDEGEHNYLRRLSNLDLIFIALASFECRGALLPKPTKKSIEQVQEYIEALPADDKPMVNLWRSDDSEQYPTRRLLASLRIPTGSDNEKTFYQIMQTVVLLHRHAKGIKLDRLAKEYKVDEGKLEGNLKFTTLWVLNAIAQICDPRKCYKLEHIKMHILELLDDISLGATLGKLLAIDGIGKTTVMKLVNLGITDMDMLIDKTDKDLLAIGIDKRKSKTIMSLVKRSRR